MVFLRATNKPTSPNPDQTIHLPPHPDILPNPGTPLATTPKSPPTTLELKTMKKLPLGHPPISSYLFHAYPLSILAQENRYLP